MNSDGDRHKRTDNWQHFAIEIHHAVSKIVTTLWWNCGPYPAFTMIQQQCMALVRTVVRDVQWINQLRREEVAGWTFGQFLNLPGNVFV